MKIKFFILPAALLLGAVLQILLLSSCDILRSSQFRVISWTPDKGYHSDPERILISLDFSHNPDKASIERNFSLTGNGSRIRGIFFWNGRRMTFTPLAPLEKNTDYVINLSANAHDSTGLSMDEPFYHDFTTRAENDRPVLLSFFPEMYAEVCDPRTEVRLVFSNPLSLNTLYDNVSFSPSMAGLWRLEDDGVSAVFTPAEPWAQRSRYEIRVSPSLTDIYGRSIGKDFTSVFTAGTDNEAPYLLYARRITKHREAFELFPYKGTFITEESPVVNHYWEKEDKLTVVFSKPVDTLTVKNYLSAEDAPGLVMETPPGFFTEVVFRFERVPVYESMFTFRIKPGIKDNAGNESREEYVYRICADGKHSKPPTLVGIRMPMAPGSGTDPDLFYAGTDSLFSNIPISTVNYPSGESIQTWIEFYFDTAEGTSEKASIDTFSLMELFRIETSNNVLAFSPRQVRTSNFSSGDPHPGLENYQRIEIAGNLTNSINFGVIYFHIGAGLKDSFGNRNEKPQRVSLIK